MQDMTYVFIDISFFTITTMHTLVHINSVSNKGKQIFLDQFHVQAGSLKNVMYFFASFPH
jgi:hypothetical protein